MAASVAMAARDVERAYGGKARGNNASALGACFYEEEGAWTPWMVPLFVGANVAVFIASMYVNNCPSYDPPYGCVARFLGRFSFQSLRQNPMLGPSSETLEKMGALEWGKVVHGHEGWRLLACIWLHGGVFHLLANMLSLVVIGIHLEQQFGFVRIGIIYLLSGFGGSVLSLLFIKNGISVGASGALFGLMGAILSELIINWTIYSNKVAALLTLLVIIVLNLAVGILPHVDNFAHIGGFFTGFLLGFVLLMRPQFNWMEHHVLPPESQAKSEYRVYQYVLLVVALFFITSGWVGDAASGRGWEQALQMVPIFEMCANLQVEMQLLMRDFDKHIEHIQTEKKRRYCYHCNTFAPV
ncbi:hypothetical protein J5N97_029918 [Dioscorea zingiberensis]|uniref:RHOMBOID-like protein n=1 Tax=Dioscorea zingiberensis TaxID=325984 RepID=A0A9D5BWQ4_9LILI|nr:hypothetical protein J5N97_029918 [Dioscorea zingiberensis]